MGVPGIDPEGDAEISELGVCCRHPKQTPEAPYIGGGDRLFGDPHAHAQMLALVAFFLTALTQIVFSVTRDRKE